ncbi:putative roundabout-like 1 isoform X2, partial [Apostichopus japonicus]
MLDESNGISSYRLCDPHCRHGRLCNPRPFHNFARSWLKNNEPLVECQGCGFSDRAGTLFFLDVGIAHAGVYRCQATNSVGTVRGRNATLQIAYLRPDFRPGPSSTVAILGNDVVLECIPPKGNPIPEVGWEKDDEPIEETDRLQIMEDYNLMISSVRLEDAGSYVCTAFNVAVDDPVKSSPANLTVRATPTFLVVPEDIIAEPGETVLFRCEVAGDPPPDLSWKKQTGELPVG